MITCPLTSDECQKKIVPLPRNVFLMMPSVKNQPDEIKNILITIQNILKKYNLTWTEGPKVTGQRDYLCNICRYIQSAAFGIAFAGEKIPKSTICNIFWEKGLMEGFGKYVMLVADSKDSLPSDFVRDTTIFYNDSGYESRFEELLKDIIDLPEYYVEIVGKSALGADDIEKASKYFTDAYMIAGDTKYEKEIDKLIRIIDKEEFKVIGFKKRILDNLITFKKGIHLKNSPGRLIK